MTRSMGIAGAVLAALIAVGPAEGQCVSPSIDVESGVYAPGAALDVTVQLTCSGSGTCGPCVLDFHLDDSCGPVLDSVGVPLQFPGGIVFFETVLHLPDDTPAGCYQIYAAPTCPGCVSPCSTCCDCCPSSDDAVLVRHPDLNGNGLVDFADLLLVIVTWGPCTDCCVIDLDGDGDVGFGDLITVLDNWG